MKNNIVVSDASPIFSLAVIGHLELLEDLFQEIYIAEAVWVEITRDNTTAYFAQIFSFFQHKVKHIQGMNELTFVMDYGESESVVLYRELKADFLLIDDRKARKYAENMGIECIGTLGVLIKAKSTGLIGELRPIFQSLIENKRYYSKILLNSLLKRFDEDIL